MKAEQTNKLLLIFLVVVAIVVIAFYANQMLNPNLSQNLNNQPGIFNSSIFNVTPDENYSVISTGNLTTLP